MDGGLFRLLNVLRLLAYVDAIVTTLVMAVIFVRIGDQIMYTTSLGPETK